MFQMLVKITAAFMLLLGLLNATSFGVSAVAFSASEKTSIHSSDVSSDYTLHDLHAQDEHGSDCADQHASTHQCHLGHCTFVISSLTRFMPLFLSGSRLFSQNEHMIGRDVTNVLRPPLA